MSLKVSVLGDSISEYEGYSNNIIGPPYTHQYPQSGTDVDSVTEIWWWEAIRQMGGQIVSNDSIGGSCVADYGIEDDNHHTGKKWCMNNQTRINDLGDSSTSSSNHPNVIMFFGGTNDLCIDSSHYKLDTFVNSYSNAVRMMFERYSNSITILCITPFDSILTTNSTTNFHQLCSGIATVVNHYRTYGYDCKLVSLEDIKLQGSDIDSHLHPSVSGMRKIADRVAYVYKNS